MSNRSMPDLLAALASQFTTLLSKEGELARTEMSENISQAAAGLGLLVVGAILLMPAIVILLQAAVSALVTSHTIEEPWASLIVGGVVLLIGIILALIGASRLKARALVPDRTIQQLQRDVAVARQQAREQQAREDHGQQHAA